MQSHRRSRGRILFEVLCAVSVGASFVGAWIQTGAWAFLAPAFVFTLFGLYWSFDMFGRDPAVAVQPAVALPPQLESQPEPVAAPEVRDIEIMAIDKFVSPEPEPLIDEPILPEPAAAFESEPEAVAEARPKRRSKKAKPSPAAAQPIVEGISSAVAGGEGHHEPHIEPLFDPKPFARQVRPAFGKRPRGPGPRPLPA